MRPDTYQLYENVTVENITGRCGSIVNLAPWKQFFNMEGSKEKPHGVIRNITISNVNVQCEKFGVIEGNPSDQVEHFVIRDVKATAKQQGFSTRYTGVKFENVLLNGTALDKK
jgi:hypothetical protein